MDTKHLCTAQDCDLPVESITIAFQTHKYVTDQGPIYRNHAAIQLVLPKENSIRLSMELASENDNLGFPNAIYCFYTQPHTSVMNFHPAVRRGLVVHEIANFFIR